AVPGGIPRAGARVVLLDLGVVGGVRVASVGGGVAAVSAVGVAAAGRGVATLGLGLRAAGGRPPVDQLHGRVWVRPGPGPGQGVRVALLRVAGVGVAAVSTVRVGVTTIRVVVALVHRRLVFLVGLRAVAPGAASVALAPAGGVTRAEARVVLLDPGVVGGVRV